MEIDKKNDIYLGDGLYAGFDGYQFILKAPREYGVHYVALEPDVFDALIRYRERCYAEVERVEIEKAKAYLQLPEHMRGKKRE